MTWTDLAAKAIKESSETSSVYIGADSVRFKKGSYPNGEPKWFARYATVIIVHRDSSKGCNVFYDICTLPDYGQIRTRMLQEVQLSLDAYDKIADAVDGRYLEIHVDVNSDPIHASNVAAKEAAGWVMGMGLNCKIKNEAWAASTAADYCANGRLKGML